MTWGLDNNGRKKTASGVEKQSLAGDRLTAKDSGQRKIVLKDCVIVAAKGIGTFEKKDYPIYDEGGVLFDLLLPEGASFNYLGKKVAGVKNIRCRNTYEELSLSIGCLEEDFIGKTVDLEFTFDSYESVVQNGEATIKNRTKRSNKLTGLRDIKQSLYGENSHMGCIMGIYENTDSVVKKYKENILMQKMQGGLG